VYCSIRFESSIKSRTSSYLLSLMNGAYELYCAEIIIAMLKTNQHPKWLLESTTSDSISRSLGILDELNETTERSFDDADLLLGQ